MMKPGSSLIALLLVAAQPLAVSQSARGEAWDCPDPVPPDPWNRGYWDPIITFGGMCEHMVLLKTGKVLCIFNQTSMTAL